jgi:hypothetical protein
VRKFLSSTKFIVGFFIVFTAMTILSIAETESDQTVAVSPTDLLKSTIAVEKTNFEIKRDLASIENPGPTKIAIKNELIDIDVLCGDTKKVNKVSTERMVMLNLNLCEEIKSSAAVSMTNITNGFKAQIFKMSAKNFRTDFIQLNSGNNILVIESVLKDGQKRVQTLEILSGS